MKVYEYSYHWTMHSSLGEDGIRKYRNYYIIEPFIRELYKVFPNSSIKTTMQMSERFVKMKVYLLFPWSFIIWKENEINLAKHELAIALNYNETSEMLETTPFIDEMKADLVIDFSGDIWGDKRNFLGDDRLVGLIKDRVAQLLGKKVVMLAGSPGPFSNKDTWFCSGSIQRFY